MRVRAGCSRYLLDLLWSTNGAAVLTWPSERNGANSNSRLGGDETATAAVGWTRARLAGREELAMAAELVAVVSSGGGERWSIQVRGRASSLPGRFQAHVQQTRSALSLARSLLSTRTGTAAYYGRRQSYTGLELREKAEAGAPRPGLNRPWASCERTGKSVSFHHEHSKPRQSRRAEGPLREGGKRRRTRSSRRRCHRGASSSSAGRTRRRSRGRSRTSRRRPRT